MDFTSSGLFFNKRKNHGTKNSEHTLHMYMYMYMYVAHIVQVKNLQVLINTRTCTTAVTVLVHSHHICSTCIHIIAELSIDCIHINTHVASLTRSATRLARWIRMDLI